MSLGDALGAQGQRQGHGGEQSLGNEGHRDTDGEGDGVLEVGLRDERDDQERDPGRDRDDRDRAHHALHLQREWAGRAHHGPSELGEPGQSRADADGGDLDHRLALDDEGAPGDIGADVEVDRDALTGDQRGVHLEGLRVDDDAVCRDPVACREHGDVVDDELDGVQLPLLAVTPHEHEAGNQVLHDGCCALGLALLGEGEDGVDDDDEGDGHGQLGHPRDEREQRGAPEQRREEVGELGEQPPPGGGRLRRGQAVVAEPGAPVHDLLVGEAAQRLVADQRHDCHSAPFRAVGPGASLLDLGPVDTVDPRPAALCLQQPPERAKGRRVEQLGGVRSV